VVTLQYIKIRSLYLCYRLYAGHHSIGEVTIQDLKQDSHFTNGFFINEINDSVATRVFLKYINKSVLEPILRSTVSKNNYQDKFVA
jgi:hypothetical protein